MWRAVGLQIPLAVAPGRVFGLRSPWLLGSVCRFVDFSLDFSYFRDPNPELLVESKRHIFKTKQSAFFTMQIVEFSGIYSTIKISYSKPVSLVSFAIRGMASLYHNIVFLALIIHWNMLTTSAQIVVPRK